MPLTMKEKQSVTVAMRNEYRKASKRRKGQMLDEYVKLTGFNRSYASRKLHSDKVGRFYKKHKKTFERRRGPKTRYGPEMLAPLKKI